MLLFHYPRLVQGFDDLRFHGFVRHVFDAFSGDEHDIPSWKRTSDIAANPPHTTFSSVAPYSAPELFPRYKSNTTVVVVLICVA